MQRVTFQRIAQPSTTPATMTSHSLAIASVEEIRLDVLVSQLTLFLISRLTARKNRELYHRGGDPNSAVLALRFKVSSVDITHN